MPDEISSQDLDFMRPFLLALLKENLRLDVEVQGNGHDGNGVAVAVKILFGDIEIAKSSDYVSLPKACACG